MLSCTRLISISSFSTMLFFFIHKTYDLIKQCLYHILILADKLVKVLSQIQASKEPEWHWLQTLLWLGLNGGQTMELGNPEKKIGIYQFR